MAATESVLSCVSCNIALNNYRTSERGRGGDWLVLRRDDGGVIAARCTM
jgi:hypothetical protein